MPRCDLRTTAFSIGGYLRFGGVDVFVRERRGCWAEQNAKAMLDRRFEDVDWNNVAEEIVDVGRNEANALESELFQILVHLLKGNYQPGKHGHSWDLSIIEHRARAGKRLRNNPSLKPRLTEVLEDAYSLARFRAAKQTGIDLDVFPIECPFTELEVLAQ